MATAIDPDDSLFAAEQRGDAGGGDRPWWQRSINLDDKLSFGTPTVMVTVLVNIFGIVIFMRMGWIVGTAGVSGALALLAISVITVLVTVFSAIGICQRCQVQSGGIYFLISHVLGCQIGGAISLVYVFGQAVGSSLVAVGFGESVARLFDSDSQIVIKLISIVTIIAVTAINVAGVQHAVRAVTVLLICVGIAASDFVLGGLFGSKEVDGVGGWNKTRLSENWDSHYEEIDCAALGFDYKAGRQTFFSLFGVLFANFLGVLAGVNMGGELQNPYKNIAKGELSAIGVSAVGCFLFILTFGASVDRNMLLCDTLVGERVSLTKLFFLAGIYIASLSSLTAGLIGTPRVLQGIAAEGFIPSLNALAANSDVNGNSPVKATIVLTVVSIIFVLVGDLNYLAILSTLPFLFTYAAVNWAYVSLAMSTDFKELKNQLTTDTSRPINNSQNYGSNNNMANAQNDLNQLFPERQAGQNVVDIGAGGDFYSPFTNRYVAFCGAVVNILICFLVNFWMSVAHVIAIAAIYYHINKKCPAIHSGISEFSVLHMIQTVLRGDAPLSQSEGNSSLLVGGVATGPRMDVEASRLNEDNEDYAHRKQYHHAENID
uniref:AA_permease domain-containing protein n=1 Tax=Panagrellus redivivus TaxID=6233 RepID=A0A7E4VC66_PANRE